MCACLLLSSATYGPLLRMLAGGRAILRADLSTGVGGGGAERSIRTSVRPQSLTYLAPECFSAKKVLEESRYSVAYALCQREKKVDEMTLD